MHTLLETQGVTKTYAAAGAWFRKGLHAREALHAVSVRAAPGERVALVGANGAGKSSLLRILAGLLLPSSGIAHVAGFDVAKNRIAAKGAVGWLAHPDRAFSGRLSGQDNLEFFGALYGLTRSQTRERIEALAAPLEAASVLKRAVRTLSTGERARLGLVRALLHRPRVLLLDEATRGLDPGAAARLRTVVTDVMREGLVVFATHDMAEMQIWSTRIWVLRQGSVIADGPFAGVKPQVDSVFEERAS